MAWRIFLPALAVLTAVLGGVKAQAGPNQLAQYNPANRTMSSNETWFIVPVATANVQAAVKYPLLPVPQDSTLWPLGFPSGMHPVVISAGYINDIRMNPENLVPLQIPSLMQGYIIVPFTDRLGDGKTPFIYPVNYYIGGTNGQDVAAVVPSLASGVSPFEGTTIFPAEFDPSDAASAYLGFGLFSAEVKPYIIPNSVSGPGVVLESYDIVYQSAPNPPIYTSHTFHSILNQPQILNEGMCQRNSIYFNATFANPQFSIGNISVTTTALGPFGLPNSPPSSLAGVYVGVTGYTANGEVVASAPESCSDSPSRVDPNATN